MQERLKLIFDTLKAENLKLQHKKCYFSQESVEFLGFKLSENGVEVNPEKQEIIRKYPVPKNVQEVKGFIGLVAYFRRMVRDFAKTAGQLYNLTRKDVKFEWTKECQEAFDNFR